MRNYKNNKLSFCFNNMLNSVPDNSRRCRDDTYNSILPYIKYNTLHHLPTPQLVYNWKHLPVTLKSVSKPLTFRTDLKQHFFSSYETDCTKLNGCSCQTHNWNTLVLLAILSAIAANFHLDIVNLICSCLALANSNNC